MRLIDVEVKLSGMSLTSFRGQMDTFLTVDIIDFCKICLFSAFFLLFGIILSLFGPYQAIFGAGMGLEKFYGVHSYRPITLIV